MLEAARKHQHRRLPMYGESPDSIVGILNTPKLLADPEVDMVEVIDFPSFVPEEMNLLELLKSFQNKKHSMAIVLDEFGTTAGLVTLEDILADIVGGLRREGDASQFVLEEQGQGRWRMTGNVWLEDFRREYPALERAPGVDTICCFVKIVIGIQRCSIFWIICKFLKSFFICFIQRLTLCFFKQRIKFFF